MSSRQLGWIKLLTVRHLLSSELLPVPTDQTRNWLCQQSHWQKEELENQHYQQCQDPTGLS
jgi:hypothetical protein